MEYILWCFFIIFKWCFVVIKATVAFDCSKSLINQNYSNLRKEYVEGRIIYLIMTDHFRQIKNLHCTEASSDVRFPLRNRNRNQNFVEAYGISLPQRFQNILFKNTLETYDSVLESRFRSFKIKYNVMYQ